MRYVVSEGDTATAVGSGDVPVLATPRLIAWMEAETVRCADPFLGPGQTSVGTAVRIEHLRATHVGGAVEVEATPPDAAAGRRLSFSVRATDEQGREVATGQIDRAIVDRDRFLDSH